jgi:hypothetical protein
MAGSVDMKHHLVTLACTAAAVAAALAAGLLLGQPPRRLQPLAEKPPAPLASVPPILAKADRLPFEPRRSGVALGPPTLPVDAVLVPAAAWVAARPDLAPAPPVASTEAMPGAPPGAPPEARHRHTICDRYGMHKVWYGRRWRCRR